MIDLTGVQHHPALSEMVDVLCNKTQNTDQGFFRAEVAYFLAKTASCQRATIATKDRGDIPVNLYALCLAGSGFGKGHSISVIEDEFLKGFRKRFMEDTMPVLAEQNLWAIANDRAARNGGDQQEEFNLVDREYRSAGSFPFTFDSGTVPAVKQLRSKLLLASCGAINLQIDEIGLNLIQNTDVLAVFLELFDNGRVKQKLVKNTIDNQRGEDIDGKTPANMLLFGTPSKLLDGAATEDLFYTFLDTGYARRCIFGYGTKQKIATETRTAAEIYDQLKNPLNQGLTQKWTGHFHQLADPAMFGWKMQVEDAVGIRLLEYKMACERAAEALPEHEEIRKTELAHRYAKALKLAGAYAFVDVSQEIEMDHLMSAILLVEESGKAFQKLLKRERAHIKLARYMAEVEDEVTNSDLMEDLPFYKGGNAFRQDMMNLAIAWGYKKNIVIKKRFQDGIEFYKGETLKETNLDEMILSYSHHWAYHYGGDPDGPISFDQLALLAQAQQPDGQPYHWCNHNFRDGHRLDEKVEPGFNMVVLDVDGGVSLDSVHELLSDYKFITYTTKRHSPDEHRFRVILPLSHHLALDQDDYREFMNAVMAFMPFQSDEGANQRARKWETFAGGFIHVHHEGELLDALPFIPKTSRNEQYLKANAKLQNLDNLERWFAQRMESGSRNNHMIKFALALVDSGMSLPEVSAQVHAFNKKLSNGLTEEEIDRTIMVTVGKRYHPNP